MQPSEEIKSKLDIVEVLRDYIQVRAAGVNFRAKCPFHREKTPSLMISPDKQIWHCFGCGKGGDIFSFVMEMEGIDFVEALRLLAPKAGVTLKREDPKLSSQRNRILDILEMARRYYHKVLLESPQAQAARQYLAKRGLKEETIEEWQIGYSPDSWDATLSGFKRSGFTENEIFLAGLAVSRRAGAEGQDARYAGQSGFYDRFRGRIMFPIRELSGNTVAFTARVSPEKEATEKMGKYINSPQTMVYDKSRILFGLDKAKSEIKKLDLAIIVEGQMDAITAHEHGFKNVVASSGTALTSEQIALLKRYSQNVAMAFDTDEAGVMAADRGIREAMAAEMNIKVIEVPSGKDPDECIRRNPGEWALAVENAKPMMQYFFDKTLGPLDLSSIENRRLAAGKLLPIIAKLGNSIERDHWLRQLTGKIDVKEELLRETLARIVGRPERTAKGQGTEERAAPSPEKLTREDRLSEHLLALLLRFPALLEYAVNHLPTEQVSGAKNRLVYKNLIFYYNNIISRQGGIGGDGDTAALYYRFKEWLEKDGTEGSAGTRTDEQAGAAFSESNQDLAAINQSKYLDRLVILGDNEFFEFTAEQAGNEAIKTILVLRKSYLRQRMREIEKFMAESEKTKDSDNMAGLMAEFKAVGDELRELDK